MNKMYPNPAHILSITLCAASLLFAAPQTPADAPLSDTLRLGTISYVPPHILPEKSDSLALPHSYSRYRIFSGDRMGMAAILGRHPFLTDAAAGLSGYPGRALSFGHPAFVAGLGDDIPLRSIEAAIGTALPLSLYLADGLLVLPNADLAALPSPPSSQPDISLLWENGGMGGRLFGNNLLGVRFKRPLTDKVTFGLVSSFEHLNRSRFDHHTGSITQTYSDAYRGLGFDTADVRRFVSTSGINPLADQQTLCLSAEVRPSENAAVRLRYAYDDRSNDFFMDAGSVNNADSLALATRRSYTHRAEIASSLHPRNSRLVAKTHFNLAHSVVRQSLPKTDSTAETTLRGLANGLAAGLDVGFLLTPADTLGIRADIEKNRLDRFGPLDDTLILGTACLYAGLAAKQLPGDFIADFSASAGVRMHEGQNERFPTPRAALELGIAKKRIHAAGFVTWDRLGPLIPFDTSFSDLRLGTDEYLTLGLSGGYAAINWGLDAAYTQFLGVNDSSAIRLWSPLAVPYASPHTVIVLAPRIGRFNGPLALLSSVQISDTKPRVKLKSNFLAKIPRGDGTRSLNFDVGFTYWSGRDTAGFGSDGFTAPIYDVSLRTTMQIHSFHLYHSVENFFNRRICYVPGQEFPGLVFRWGFNWQILN